MTFQDTIGLKVFHPYSHLTVNSLWTFVPCYMPSNAWHTVHIYHVFIERRKE